MEEEPFRVSSLFFFSLIELFGDVFSLSKLFGKCVFRYLKVWWAGDVVEERYGWHVVECGLLLLSPLLAGVK